MAILQVSASVFLWSFVALLSSFKNSKAFVVAFSSPSIQGPTARPKSQEGAPAFSSVTPLTFSYTHLEVNGMIWQIPEVNVSLVIDPIASELNFGIPWVYRANKKVLDEEATFRAIVEAAPTHCLLSQGLDDHTHLPTLSRLVEKLPNLQFLVAPSALDKLASILPNDRASRITVLSSGQVYALTPEVTIRATQGALVGPPWQARENGWLLLVQGRGIVYMEPHADVDNEALRGLQADICISPVKEQSLPAQLPRIGQFTLVYGGSRTLEIAQALRASTVIPLGNGDLRTAGPLAKLVQATGSVADFDELVRKSPHLNIRVERPTPGIPLYVQVQNQTDDSSETNMKT